MHYLKDKPADLPEAYVFLTGINEWRRHDSWPPRDAKDMQLFLGPDGTLVTEAPFGGVAGYDEYISDPNRPVPYLGYIVQGMTSDYMTEDQRFASQRPDVLVYRTEPLERDLTIAGPIQVNLNVSTTGTDSDFVVKLIDVYPGDYPTPAPPSGQRPAPNSVKMGGYQQLVRGEPFRARFHNGFEAPEAMTPGKPASLRYTMPDVYHAFRRGHRIMIQVQSSWFPLVDRNPQTFVEIPKARPEDFKKATQRIYRTQELPSSITVLVEGAPLNKEP
jgi:putative CocE/NonD family hydrolase